MDSALTIEIHRDFLAHQIEESVLLLSLIL